MPVDQIHHFVLEWAKNYYNRPILLGMSLKNKNETDNLRYEK